MIADIRLELVATKGVRTKKAFQFLIAMVCSWEVEVTDVRKIDTQRLRCWEKLVSIWGAFRTSDKSGIPPNRMRWTPEGLQGDITLTKTTGSGKRVGCLKFAISVNAWFIATNWLRTGWELFQKYSTERSFFLPLPSKDFMSYGTHEPSYVQQVAMEKKLCVRVPFARIWLTTMIPGSSRGS